MISMIGKVAKRITMIAKYIIFFISQIFGFCLFGYKDRFHRDRTRISNTDHKPCTMYNRSIVEMLNISAVFLSCIIITIFSRSARGVYET